MNLLIISSYGYPSEQNLYNSGFVHTRVIGYKKFGHNCIVFVPGTSRSEYTFENVNVVIGGEDKLHELLEKFSPDIMLVHFPHKMIYKYLRTRRKIIPLIFWVHGYGNINWFRFLFEFELNWRFFLYLYINLRNLFLFHFMAKNHEKKKIFFVFISEWMLKISSGDSFSKFSKYAVIPNPIDNYSFIYYPKNSDDVKKILVIKSFENKKYANDISVKAILELSKKDYFHEFQIDIFGKGRFFDSLTKPLLKFKNVTLHKKFLTSSEMSAAHKKFGIFLTPSRMDAQGVSMCEAMSSGLVPITSNNTALPEFVNDGIDGFLTNNYMEIVEKIEYLYLHPSEFLKMSANAAKNIIAKAGIDKVAADELNFIQSVAKSITENTL